MVSGMEFTALGGVRERYKVVHRGSVYTLVSHMDGTLFPVDANGARTHIGGVTRFREWAGQPIPLDDSDNPAARPLPDETRA